MFLPAFYRAFSAAIAVIIGAVQRRRQHFQLRASNGFSRFLATYSLAVFLAAIVTFAPVNIQGACNTRPPGNCNDCYFAPDSCCSSGETCITNVCVRPGESAEGRKCVPTYYACVDPYYNACDWNPCGF